MSDDAADQAPPATCDFSYIDISWKVFDGYEPSPGSWMPCVRTSMNLGYSCKVFYDVKKAEHNPTRPKPKGAAPKMDPGTLAENLWQRSSTTRSSAVNQLGHEILINNHSLETLAYTERLLDLGSCK